MGASYGSGMNVSSRNNITGKKIMLHELRKISAMCDTRTDMLSIERAAINAILKEFKNLLDNVDAQSLDDVRLDTYYVTAYTHSGKYELTYKAIYALFSAFKNRIENYKAND